MSQNADRSVGFLGAAATAAAVLAALEDNPWISWPSVAVLAVIIGYIIRFFIKTLKSSKRLLAGVSFAGPALAALLIVAVFKVFGGHPATSSPWCSPLAQSGSGSAPALARSARDPGSAGIDKVVIVEEHGPGLEGCAKFDISMRNPTAKPVFVDLAQIHVLKVWSLPQTCSVGGRGGGGVEPSKNYDFTMSVAGPGVTPLDEVSQLVDAGGVDRFSLTARLASPPEHGLVQRLVEARLEVFTDGSEKPIASQPFIFATQPDIQPAEVLLPGTIATAPAQSAQNSRAVLEADQTSTVRTGLASRLLDYNQRNGPRACR